MSEYPKKNWEDHREFGGDIADKRKGRWALVSENREARRSKKEEKYDL